MIQIIIMILEQSYITKHKKVPAVIGPIITIRGRDKRCPYILPYFFKSSLVKLFINHCCVNHKAYDSTIDNQVSHVVV